MTNGKIGKLQAFPNVRQSPSIAVIAPLSRGCPGLILRSSCGVSRRCLCPKIAIEAIIKSGTGYTGQNRRQRKTVYILFLLFGRAGNAHPNSRWKLGCRRAGVYPELIEGPLALFCSFAQARSKNPLGFCRSQKGAQTPPRRRLNPSRKGAAER
jgi:hypothetical protein